MQLNDIIERYSVSDISRRTNISKEDVEILFQGDFENLTRVKTLGFISILEREYKIDLSSFKEVAISHYDQHGGVEKSIVLTTPYEAEKGGSSKLFVFFVLLLLGGASWYFFTQFDKKLLNGLLPFGEEEISRLLSNEVNESASLSIESVIAPVEADTVTVEKSAPQSSVVLVESSVEQSSAVVVESESVTVSETNETSGEKNSTAIIE